MKPQSRRKPKSQVCCVSQLSPTKLSPPAPRWASTPQLPFSYLFEASPTKMTATPSTVHQSPLWLQQREKSLLCGLTRLPPFLVFHFPFPQSPHSVTTSHSHVSSWKASCHIPLFFSPPRKRAHTMMMPVARSIGSAWQLKALILTSPPQTAHQVANRLLSLNNSSQQRLKRDLGRNCQAFGKIIKYAD